MKKKKKLIIFSSIFIVLIISAIIFIVKSGEETDNKIIETTTEIAEVSSQTITTTLTAPGEVKSAETEKLTLNTSYYYLNMCAESGDYVEKGDNLLKYTNGVYIVAPYNCVITDYSVPNAKSICTSSNYIAISSVEDLYMDIDISEEEIDKISVNQEVEIIANYDESKTYTGTISKINAIGTYSSGRTNFAAIASIKNDGTLKIGMSATCNVTIEKQDNLPCVPIEAVEVEDDKKYVTIVNDNNEEEKVEIETGVSNANYVHVTSGLELGDKVKYTKTTVTVVETEEEESENPLTSLFGGGKGGRK